ncbi:hypothetical protein [Janthinobacterium sp. AD80]|uniref:hypothetical protein n=1 Tax=Janthinobacterium sp. AD80 TaxID=1528773 RepID=UPI0011AF52D6|nr:hypothetical protein [Janthinobacterium sp. AD80]
MGKFFCQRYLRHFFLFYFFVFCDVSARTVLSAGDEKSFSRAISVYEVEILEYAKIGKNNFNCGVVYTAKVSETLKGKKVNSKFQFGFLEGLEIGSSYVVYLAPERNKKLLRDILKSRMMTDDDVRSFNKYCPSNFSNYYFHSKKINIK